MYFLDSVNSEFIEEDPKYFFRETSKSFYFHEQIALAILIFYTYYRDHSYFETNYTDHPYSLYFL